MARKRGLGEKGLGALLKGSSVDLKDETTQDGQLKQLPIELLQRGKYQPRRDMDPEALEELAESIRQQGVMQPIIVRSVSDDRYEIIAGERRWRAAQMAGLKTIPSIIRDVDDSTAIAMALIENIQREDLNAMEEAVALERLLTEFDLTHQEVALAVGKSRTTVTNLLRLNNLNDEVKTFLENGDLEMGHARALLALDDSLQAAAARTVATKELTVRETEALIKKIQNPVADKEKVEKDIETIDLEQGLAEKLGAKVAISHNKKGKGKLVISYANLEKLEEILAKIN